MERVVHMLGFEFDSSTISTFKVLLLFLNHCNYSHYSNDIRINSLPCPFSNQTVGVLQKNCFIKVWAVILVLSKFYATEKPICLERAIAYYLSH